MYLKFFKPIIDFVSALLFILLTLPLTIPVSIILLLTGEHQVFFLQDRVGYKSSIFRTWKFTTMVKNSSKMGLGSLSLRKDPRVLPVGRFLRRTKINELPQFINVLMGNMAIVGARPQMKVDFEKYSPEIQARIYDTPPGITGTGSIIFRNEDVLISKAGDDKHEFYKNHIVPYKGEVEMWYQENVSFLTDIILIFITIWVLLFPKSELIYRVFKSLPPKPHELSNLQ